MSELSENWLVFEVGDKVFCRYLGQPVGYLAKDTEWCLVTERYKPIPATVLTKMIEIVKEIDERPKRYTVEWVKGQELLEGDCILHGQSGRPELVTSHYAVHPSVWYARVLKT